jgi:hypothetical protein
MRSRSAPATVEELKAPIRKKITSSVDCFAETAMDPPAAGDNAAFNFVELAGKFA